MDCRTHGAKFGAPLTLRWRWRKITQTICVLRKITQTITKTNDTILSGGVMRMEVCRHRILSIANGLLLIRSVLEYVGVVW